ncbi:hypothetical protein HDC92_004770 [Pedobacter sp. AK017]|uniref:hypothetical protein n=1 Tax=Pedobacter sp. AK017 TaxID=2723073 RepID=UPI00161B7A7C|nr:hypothetical protein [Pedobacter sp. AK017]MBB5441066.1 hypothetical protein [Pedobacter sp. AK017]
MENTTLKKSPTYVGSAGNNSDYGDMSKNEITFERKKVEGTPFVKIWSKQHGWAAGIAEHRITQWFETEEKLDKKLKGTTAGKLDWDLLTGFVSILIEKTEDLKKQQEEIVKRNNEQI